VAAHLIHDKLVGAYVYAVKVDGVTCYIGKGRRYRVTEHLRYARQLNRRRAAGEKIQARPFYNWLAKADRDGRRITYEIIAFGLSDLDAYERERQEIASASGLDLWNVLPGGEGTDGEFIRSLWRQTEFREKVMNARRKAMYENEEWRERQRQGANDQWSDPQKKLKHYEGHRRLWDDPVAAEERRILLRKVWADPEKKAAKRELVKSQWTPERRAAMAENRRQAWADPEFKARVSIKIAIAKAAKKDDRSRQGGILVAERPEEI
jgi:hypothetical protein